MSEQDTHGDKQTPRKKRGIKVDPKQLHLPMKGMKKDDELLNGEAEDAVLTGSDLQAGRSYWFVLFGLVVLVLVLAVHIVKQTQERHDTYRQLSQARQAYQSMQIEEARLIIEQQTFSATPQVAQRAVNELGMFYPVEKNRVVVTTE